jgi:ParB family transcriptional regulator, chromosome partitioning protein
MRRTFLEVLSRLSTGRRLVTPQESTRRLGRGLGALLAPQAATPPSGTAEGSVQRIAISDIQPNQFQPRKTFDPAELDELAASLKMSGLLQPVAVRPAREPADVAPGSRGRRPRYELLAGERRFRAAAQLGWTEIPAIVRDVDDRGALTLALVENLQRSDLNPMEEAEGYALLLQSHSLTQQEVADAVGKDRSTVANTLRLHNLPAAVRGLVRDGQLSVGHARALLALGSAHDITAAARDVIAKNLTVREIESLSQDSHAPVKRRKRATKAGRRLDSHGKEIEDRMRRYLQTDVRLSLTARDRGQLSILFYSNDDLERVLELILGRTGDGL